MDELEEYHRHRNDREHIDIHGAAY